MIKLRLTAKGTEQVYLGKIIKEQVLKLELLIPNLICGYDSEKIEEVVGKLLITKTNISVAESCTGGNIAHLITSISGSSEYF